MQPTFVRPPWSIVVVVLALALSGCATLVNRPLQQVPVASAPSGAQVFVDGTLAGRTPMTLELARDSEHEVLVRLGDRELSVTLRSGIDTAFVAFDVVPGLVMAGVSALVLVNSPDRTFEPSGPIYLPDFNPAIRRGAAIGIAIGLGSAAINAGVDAGSGRWYRLTPGEVLVVFD